MKSANKNNRVSVGTLRQTRATNPHASMAKQKNGAIFPKTRLTSCHVVVVEFAVGPGDTGGAHSGEQQAATDIGYLRHPITDAASD